MAERNWTEAEIEKAHQNKLVGWSYPTAVQHGPNGEVNRFPLQPFNRTGVKARVRRESKRAIMESLGLVRVRGAVSGRIYYE